MDASTVDASFDVAAANGEVRAHAIHLRLVTDRILPATKRALDATRPGYETGRTELFSLLMAQRDLVETELEIVITRAALDHAMIELDAAVGIDVPRVKLGSVP